MIQRSWIAALSALLFAAACTSDMPADSPLAPVASHGGGQIPPSPPAPPVPVGPLASISVSPLTVPAGAMSTATVTLKAAAPAGGLLILPSTNLPLSVTVPDSVRVPAGATSVSYTLQSHIGFPNSTTTPRITATVPGESVETGLNIVTGDVPPTPGLSLVTISTATVVGGNSVIGTVNLATPAPAGGALITLFSQNTAVANTPPNMTIPAGVLSGTFVITTVPVTVLSEANISVGYLGGFLTKTLNITPPVTGPLGAPSLLSPAANSQFAPGTTITFDWSDVTGAVSYEIQIDANDKFPAPFVVDVREATSQFATSALPKQALVWRVRAFNSAGTAGAWSSVQKFEVK